MRDPKDDFFMFQSILLPALSFGLSAGLIPGPLQAYLLNVSMQQGWRRGLMVAISPFFSDPPVIIGVVFILGQLPSEAIRAIQIFGGLFVFWIAWGVFKQLQSGVRLGGASDGEVIAQQTPLRILGTACAINLLSPGAYIFWSTILGPLLIQAINEGLPAVIGFFVAFYGAFFTLLVLQVGIYYRVGQVSETLTRRILWGMIVLLIFFGIRLILG